jgi:thioredoxin-dependent peroxiredoxin
VATLSRRFFAVSLVSLWMISCAAPQRPDGGKGLLPAGAPVPALRATDQDSKPLDLASERGHMLVVFFYPKDGTPGCTAEACSFRDVWKRYDEAGVKVIGVSSDDAASHKEFAAEHRLPFPLVSDTDGAWARAFGVSSTLGMYRRVTFLIDVDGKVARVYPEVDPGVHAQRVLNDAAVR